MYKWLINTHTSVQQQTQRLFVATTSAQPPPHRHPFVPDILEVLFTLDVYDDFIYSSKHIDEYVTQMSLYTTKDVVSCHVFPPYWKVKLFIGLTISFQIPLSLLKP